MAKKSYIGVSSTARKVKKVYIGIGGVARKVKKIYIGIAGVARAIFGGGEIKFDRLINDSNQIRYGVGISLQNIAIFGGSQNNNISPRAYNASLVMTSAPTLLAYNRHGVAGAKAGNNAFFMGGAAYQSSYSAYASKSVEYYNEALTQTALGEKLTASRVNAVGVSNGQYAIAGAGQTYSSSTPNKTVEAFNSIGTHYTLPNLDYAKNSIASASFNNHAILAGGSYSSTRYQDVEAYDTNLTKKYLPNLSEKKYGHIGASNNKYAVFAGGHTTQRVGTVEAYDSDFTKVFGANITPREYSSCQGLDDFIVIKGGASDTDSGYLVEAIDSSLTKINLPNSAQYTSSTVASGVVANYMLFLNNSNTEVYNVS